MRVKNPVSSLVDLIFRKVPLEAQLIVTRRCNLTCGYCTEYDDYSPPIPFETLKERIDALHRLRVVNISMLGGEPLMHPQLVEAVEYSNRKCQVSITTNGFLVTEELVKRLNKVGLQNMEVSIDALNFDKTGYIQKTLRTLGPKLQILKKNATFDVHVNMVLCESSKDTFKETIEEIKKFGFHIAIDIFHEANGQIGVKGPEFVDLWEHHYEKGSPFSYMEYQYGKELLEGKTSNWKCRAGSRMLYVDEFGKVQYCSSQRGRLDIPVTEYTFKDLKRESKTYKGCEVGCSLLCGYRDSQLDNAPFHVIKSLYRAYRKGVFSKSPPRHLQLPSAEQKPAYS